MARDGPSSRRWSPRGITSILCSFALLALATSCIIGEDQPHGVNVFNRTDHTLTIYYDKPDRSPAIEDMADELNTRAVVEPNSNGRFSIPEPDDCAKVDLVAMDEDETVVDRLPAGTCHADETVDWTISAP